MLDLAVVVLVSRLTPMEIQSDSKDLFLDFSLILKLSAKCFEGSNARGIMPSKRSKKAR